MTQRIYKILFFSVNVLMLLTNFIDARFFEFINKRSTSSIFTLLGTNQDVWLLIPQFIKDYWYVALSWVVTSVLFWIYMPVLPFRKIISEKLTVKSALFQVLIFACIVGLMFLGGRGLKLKPLSIIDAANFTNLKHVPLVLNTPFSIIKTLENENLEPEQYFREDTLEQIYNPVRQYNSGKPFAKKNVVVLILESFSREYCGYLSGNEGYTPCLDSILKNSLVFDRAYANGTQSYEAMPAIIAGIPSLMDRPYSGSNYADNLIESLPGLLKKQGYYTAFYHGGNNGTMGFSNFARVAGIQDYRGRNEYGNEADFDGNWGIWDEPYLQYFARQINGFRQPFFVSVFTLSSHHPYNVPDRYKKKFPEGTLPIHKSIRYADYALGKFFKTASQMPWYTNTLFVFSADHAAQAVDKKYNSTTGRYAIPIAFFDPSDPSLIGISHTIAQQIDILPSVLDYLGYQKKFFAFGASLFSNSEPHRAITFVNGMYQLIEGDYVMAFNGKDVTAFSRLDDDTVENNQETLKLITNAGKHPEYDQMERTIKAFIQTYNNRLINNNTTLGQNK